MTAAVVEVVERSGAMVVVVVSVPPTTNVNMALFEKL
jgi:hypothetical protein